MYLILTVEDKKMLILIVNPISAGLNQIFSQVYMLVDCNNHFASTNEQVKQTAGVFYLFQ